ncbi:MAG: hypothetical protein ABW007_15490 [Chitinophagaceae bacterium]
MPILNSVDDLIHYARDLAEPFIFGRYVPDWERRSGIISAISDYLIIRIRDDAFVDDQSSTRPLECEADVGYRATLARGVRDTMTGESLAFPKVGLADDKDIPTLTELCSTLDYSEKVVISAAAFAIVKLSPSTELLSVIANILFEEAYHLKIVSEMLGLDQSTRPWLSPDKSVNWELVKSCEDGFTYMLLEHVLYEGRGGIAAAKGVHEARVRGVSERSVKWLEKICNQETNHGISGLVWLARDEHGAGLSPTDRLLIRRFIEQECDDTTGTFRTLRQRYSTWLLERYLGGTPLQELVASLKGDVVRCQYTGEIGPTLDDLSRSVDSLYASMSRERAWK